MNISTITKALILPLAVVALFAGCSSGGYEAENEGGVDFVDPNPVAGEDEFDLSMTSAPFDETRQLVSEIVLEPIYFGYDSYILPPSETGKIQQIVAILNDNPGFVMIIAGHCDDRGSNEYNLSLGEQRALTVRDNIVSMGISADRIQSRSFGEERPAVLGSGEDVWRLNRRGEFSFYR